MKRFFPYLFDWIFNPILIKELRSRMRGARAFITLTAMLIFLVAFSYGLFRVTMVTAAYSSTPMSPLIGQTVFAGLAFLELLMVCAIAPAVTAGSISGEKEKLTYEMLLATPLPPASMLWGKLVSALSYVFLLIFAAIPLASLIFIFGGVSLRDMVKVLIILAIVAVMMGVLGLFMSTLFGRTGRATAATYMIVILLLFGPIFVASGVGLMKQSEPPSWIMIPSPISALSSAMSPSVNINNLSSIFWMLGNLYWFFGQTPISMNSIPRPLYHYSLPIYIGMTLLMYMLTTRLILPARRWQIHWSQVLVALVLILGFIGLLTAAYVTTTNRYEGVQIPPTATPLSDLESMPAIENIAIPVESTP